VNVGMFITLWSLLTAATGARELVEVVFFALRDGAVSVW
jgi:hypothetical protein